MFAIHLQVDLACGGGREDRLPGTKCRNALHARVPMERDPEHVPEVGKRTGSLEQNQLELIVQKRRAPGDLQVAAVIPNAAGKRKTGSKRLTLGFHRKLGKPAAEFGETSQPVSRFSERRLQAQRQMIHDVGIETSSGH